MVLKGRVAKLFPATTGVSQSTGKTWAKQEFLFGYYESPSDLYERQIKLEIMNERIQQLQLAENDEITVRITLHCREYPQGSGKYFNDVRTGEVTVDKRHLAGNREAQQPQS